MAVELSLFTVEGDQLVPTVHCYSLSALYNIRRHYGESTSLEVYKYLFYKCSLSSQNNPFFNLPEVEKDAAIFEQVDGSNFSPEDQLVQAGIELCQLLFTTPTTRMFRAVKTSIENISEFLETTAVKGGKDGNVTQIVSAIEKFDRIRNSFKGVAKDLEEEQNALARGGIELAYDQKR